MVWYLEKALWKVEAYLSLNTDCLYKLIRALVKEISMPLSTTEMLKFYRYICIKVYMLMVNVIVAFHCRLCNGGR